MHRILRTALSEAVRRDRVPVNPVTRAPRLVELEIEPRPPQEASRIVTAATMLLVQGVAPRTALDITGWTEARMLSRYQHVVDDLRHDTARRMGAAHWATPTRLR